MSEKKSNTPEVNESTDQKTEIAIIDERTIRNKIYVVRGVQVMLDFELAEIYGYTTSAFNQQVKRNEDKFPADFRFRLTKEEFHILLSQNVTASWGGDINIKTLRLLQNVQPGVAVTVFSDNVGKHLHASDCADFQTEFPNIPVSFISIGGTMHVRFIFLDYGEDDERIFHCGASSKDAAVRLTTAITEITSELLKTSLHTLVNQMKQNPPLNVQ